jgi:nitroimidazol reductase NimA-like FMN-containing flavoprotein (pyridoxamine 5'-phosphate oxidase superfamily)
MTEPASLTSSGRPLATEMLDLTRAECLRLLAATGLGRIVVTLPDPEVPTANRAVIRPVNYVFDEPSQSVLIRSAPGSKLRAILGSPRAMFEIDGAHPDGRIGWSVIVSGLAEEITNEAELRRVQQLDLEPLPPGYQGHWIRIHTTVVSGRRIGFVSDSASTGAA